MREVDAGAAVAALLGLALWIAPGPPSLQRLRAWGRSTRPAAGGRRIIVACAVVSAVAAVVLWGAASAVCIVMGTATIMHLRSRRAAVARGRAAAAELASALEIVVAELRVGAHPGRACAVAALHARRGAVSGRLARAAAQAQLGGAISRVLAAGDGATAGARRTGQSWPAGGRNAEACGPDADWRRIAVVWAVAERRGIALGGLLDAARADLAVRVSFRRRAESGLAGARSTATILAALPVVGVGFGHLMGAAPLAVLTGGGAGGFLLVAGVLLDCAGLVWAERIMSGTAR
ncbi:type II secretion system F family protein [Tomitella gaofuii]|uniref:type II secretion system F family protein n=1 Tax=Tomitella gaofuii TaxID=2760083 RepID=UPI0020BEE9D5|nr:secretion protein F [Tomitella gaofuii]